MARVSRAADATIDLANAPYEAQQLAEWLTRGKPELGWEGDPRLECRVGLLVAASTGYDRHRNKTYRKGDTVAFRLEVHRHCEDGSYEEIISRDVDKFHEIIPALCKMRAGHRGFEDTFDEVVRNNNAVELKAATAIREAKAEHIEHLWKLVADRQNGKTTFRQMPGSNPDKQM